MSVPMGCLDQTVEAEMRRFRDDPSTSFDLAYCISTVATSATPGFRRRDLEARSESVFVNGPYVEYCGRIAIAYFAAFDDGGYVTEVVFLHVGLTAPTGYPPLYWGWRKTAVDRYRQYLAR